ncbi:MAG: Flp family type IVb pilin [Actinomycetota bacterium]|nr:Flp family type IVb pilin [Actinomycetota bacterium]
MLAYLRKVMRSAEDRGASAVEYGLMVAAIAAVIVTAVFALGQTVNKAFVDTNACIGNQASCPGGAVTTSATQP